MNTALPGNSRASERGSVFVLVLWISFGMVVLALYFAHSMNFELRAGDNRVAALEADHAINGAARYVEYVLTHHGTNGMVPDTTLYSAENVPIGSASTTTRSTDLTGVPAFWMLGRDAEATSTTIPTGVPTFGLIDEASKLNLNATNLTTAMLELLPGMTPAIAAAILDWRDADSTTTEEGAEDDLYQRLIPARSCKNGNFESVDELRLVYGVTLAMLYGEDLNQNGVLDINENDGERTLPPDNLDGRLDPGFLEYFTIYSRQPNITVLGSNRVDIANRQALTTLLTEKISQARATAIIQALGPTNNPVRSILEFYSRSGMTEDEFELVETELTAVPGPHVEGLVNVNTASEAVLGCIPGIGVEVAPNIVAQRRNNPKNVNTLAWVKEVLTTEQIAQAGPYLTGQSYQFTADVVALGHNGRGHQRARFVFDMTENVPKILHREDLSRFGWALGKEVRHEIRAGIASSLRK